MENTSDVSSVPLSSFIFPTMLFFGKGDDIMVLFEEVRDGLSILSPVVDKNLIEGFDVVFTMT